MVSAESIGEAIGKIPEWKEANERNWKLAALKDDLQTFQPSEMPSLLQ